MLDLKVVFILQIPCLSLALFALDEKTERTALLRNGINHYTNTQKRPSELHTSTYHLEKFLEEEEAYVRRLKQIIKNEIMSIDGTKQIASYVASFDDIVQKQNRSYDTFMHNPVNVYNLVRHVGIGWPVAEKVKIKRFSNQKVGE